MTDSRGCARASQRARAGVHAASIDGFHRCERFGRLLLTPPSHPTLSLTPSPFPGVGRVAPLSALRRFLHACSRSQGGVLIPPEENVERFQWSPGMSAEALAAETAALLLEQQQEQLDVAADGDGVHGGDDGDGVHGGDDCDCRGGGRSSRSGAGIGGGDGAGANAGADAHVGGERRGFAEGSGAPGGSVASLREDRGKCDADMAKEPTGAAATAGLDGRGGGGHDDGGAADDGVVCDADADSNGSRRRGEAGEQAEAARRLHEQRQALEALFAQDGGAEGSL
eukprot:4168636-Pleurochrysis_carterae.AAC.3